ncbi:T9SS type A sorting domain-containing protein [Winogradskyella sp. 3972H.M.0a.05]|uniref:T9SS type A sorting domain-containing protein n=1 Tax=Winogradskyella sp. 3972H.M.0a.05 TaxID=2950277 RepID=UPI003393A4B8
MKKLYSFIVAIMVASLSFGQDMIITGAFDGPLTGGTPKLVEIYVVNDIADLSLYGLGSANNGGGSDGEELTFSGSATAGQFIYVGSEGSNPGSVNAYFGITADYLDSTANVNGDDALELFFNTAVIDTFGDINTDGTGQPWEYLDGWAYRNNGTGPDGTTFNLSSWSFSGPNATDGCTDNGSCASVFPIGTYTTAGSSCGVTFGTALVACDSSTIGDDNDNVTISIPYTGSDAGITSVTTTSGGTIAGDDPSTTADGTIILLGLSEGDAWDVVLNGGDCDGRDISGTVDSALCDPTPNTCFDLSTGGELFELVTVTTNSDMDVWTLNAGTYSMNGFCGGGCEELVDTWLIFGPLDMTGVTDLSLLFDAAENFGTTDLTVNYASSYSGCPDSTSWTLAQTITDAGAINVDLSAASGTTVFIGINYNDDGVDGYSDWDLSNVELAAFGACPTLGSRPTSDCATCDVSLGTENYVCNSMTAGADNDSVTIEIPYTGTDNTLVSVTTTSGGTVGGDNPALTADGTITITGLSEGSAWDITLNGGDCDGTTISGTVPSTLCDPVSCGSPGDIIITEIMQNPAAVSDADGEYFEVYNTTGSPIDMNGWIIKDEATVSETHTISGSVIVPANGYALFAINGDFATNGGLNEDYVYSNITLGNGTDGLIIECSSTTIDQVVWDNGATFPDPTGASMQLDMTAFNDTDNDVGTNWGIGVATYGDGDTGTPGSANDFSLSVTQFEQNSFSIYPNPSNLGFVNITSNNAQAITAVVYDILGKQVKNETISNNRLDVSNLVAGVYIIKLTQDGASTTKKLVIK